MDSSLAIACLGLVASILTEVVALFNKVLTGTFLQGRAAFIMSIICAFLFGAFKVFLSHNDGVEAALNTIIQVWAASQVAFVFVLKPLGIEITPANPVQ